jgi:hypothetical protein
MLVEVRAELDGPIILDRPLHLDGLLIAVQAQRLGLPVVTREMPLVDIPHIPIPVSRFNGIYRCSAAYYLDAQRGRHFWTRRKDAEDVERYDKPFNRGYGPARDLMRRASVVLASEARWLVHTTDVDSLRDLLDGVHAIGGLRAHGLGRVRAWHVEPVPHGHADDTLVRDGLVMRTMPASMLILGPGVTVSATCEPPYWHPARVVDAVLPGSEGWPKWREA